MNDFAGAIPFRMSGLDALPYVIFTEHTARAGNGFAYARLLEEITPRIRRIVRSQRAFLQVEDIEDRDEPTSPMTIFTESRSCITFSAKARLYRCNALAQHDFETTAGAHKHNRVH